MHSAKEEREFDIILYGATGYTAGYVIKELETTTCKIAVAARDVSRVTGTSAPKINCIIDNIEQVTARTKVLINCVGPYTPTAEKILQACIETSTHYVDICGESLFIDEMLKKYQGAAKEKGVRIVQSCGFDSLPADIGTASVAKMHDIREVDVCHVVENGKINVTTWRSLLISLREKNRQQKIRKEQRSSMKESTESSSIHSTESINKSTSSFKRDRKRKRKFRESTSVLSTLKERKAELPEYRYNKDLQSWDVKFRGTDPYIIKRSCDHFRAKGTSDIRFCCYWNVGDLFSLVSYFLFAFMCMFLIRFDFFFSLMCRYPRFFTFGHVVTNPSIRDTEKSKFRVIIRGASTKGAGDRTLTISGIDPGYRSTAVFVVQAAVTLLEELEKTPKGIHTPAVAFENTRIVDRLIAKGIRFDYQSK